jgi:hypothetical protein
MKKSTLLKLALFLVAVLLFVGAQAQTAITVYKNDGTNATAPTIFSVNTTTGVETAVATSGYVAPVLTTTATLTVGTTYIVKDGTESRPFVFAAGPMTIRLAISAITGGYSQAVTTTYQTIGKDFRLYVAPDPIYSPGYNGAGTTATISPNSTWTWTYATLTGVPATTVPSAAQTNWVEFTGSATTTAVIPVSVVENNSLSGCASSTPVVQNVQFVNTPDATVSVPALSAYWTNTATVGQTITSRACVSAITGTETVRATITEDANIPTAFRAYSFKIVQTIQNLTSDLSGTDGAAASIDLVDYTLAAKLGGSGVVPGTHSWTVATGFYTFPTATLAVTNGKPTRYTYSIQPSGTAIGIVSAISQKSDALENLGGTVANGYAYGLAGVVNYAFIVLPSPVTGPIYHISNSFAL